MQARILAQGDEALLIEAARSVSDPDDPPPSRERAQALLADPCFVAATALDQGRPAGLVYCHVLPQLSRTGLLLYAVDTAEPQRRKGAARAMIEALKALCRERGYYEMWVLTGASNTAAMRLYASCGGVRETFDDVMWVFPAGG